MIQLQVINSILTSKDMSIVTLNNLDDSYFSDYKDEFNFIKEHYEKYSKVPDKETFVDKFTEFQFIDVKESTKYLVDKLQEDFVYRKTYEVLEKVSKEMTEGDSRNAVEMLLSKMPDLTKKLNYEAVDLVSNAELRFNEYVDKGENLDKYFISTGLKELDEVIGGWDKANDLVAICGRPGKGKSWWVDYFGLAACKNGKTVVLYSGEMNESQVGYRLDTFFSHISNYKISKGYSDIFQEYKDSISKFKELPGKFLVCTPSKLNGKATVSKLRAFCERNKADILLVDQYSLLSDSFGIKNRNERFEQVSMELKLLQSELSIPVLVACQLGRSATTKETGDPGTEDIAGSDRIAQDASIAITILNKKDDIVQLNIIKSRSGKTGDKLEYVWNIDTGVLNYSPSDIDGINNNKNEEEVKQSHEKEKKKFNDSEDIDF